MRFTIDLKTGNDAMRTYPAIRAAIKEALMPERIRPNARNFRVPHEGDSGKIMDVNGNSVGTWQVLDDKPMPSGDYPLQPMRERLSTDKPNPALTAAYFGPDMAEYRKAHPSGADTAATCHSCGKTGHKQPACTEVPTIYPK